MTDTCTPRVVFYFPGSGHPVDDGRLTRTEKDRAQCAILVASDDDAYSMIERAAVAEGLESADMKIMEAAARANAALRMLLIGVCSTLTRAESMGVPDAGRMLAVVRDAATTPKDDDQWETTTFPDGHSETWPKGHTPKEGETP